jgi:hypothetical protein
MREFKFLTGNKRIYYEGREVVYVGFILYEPTSFDGLRRIRLRDNGGRIDEIEINDTHPLWIEVMGMSGYSI